MYADSLGFLVSPGMPLKFENLPNTQVMHVTCVPPFVRGYKQALKEISKFKNEVLQNKGVYLIRSAQDLANPPEGGSLGLVLGMQHTPEGSATLEHLRDLKRAGLKVLGLAYNTKNSYGCGCMEAKDTGLTDEGKSLIKNMADVGMVLDLSHVGDKTAMDALLLIDEKGLSTVPMASHSACGVYNHPQNLSDELIVYIAMLGGYVGIPAISSFLCEEGKDSVSAMVQHITHAIDVCNKDTVGIGSDCPWTNADLSAAEKDFERMKKMLKTNGLLGECFLDRPESIIQNGSNLMKVISYALKDFSPQLVEKVCGGNFINYLKRAL